MAGATGVMSRRPLFVLDLNGTLLERLTSSTAKQAYRSNIHYNEAEKYDTTINGNPMVLRPHLSTFLACLNSKGQIAVWTSMKKKNADAVCDFIFASLLPATPRFVWNQSECSFDNRKSGYKREGCKKPLDKIWKEFPDEYDAMNTIMIDDSASKLELHVENHLHIPEFQLVKGDFRADSVLLELAKRIDALPDNVLDYRHLIPKLSADLSQYSAAVCSSLTLDCDSRFGL